MDLGLKDQVVLITGGSKGIGLACARGFLAEGARVALASRSQANLDLAAASLAAGDRIVTIPADLSQEEAALKMARRVEEALGPVDILVNSAGAAKRYLPEELQAGSWHDAMDAKYFTYIHAMDAILPGMAARGRGVVVNIIGSGGKVASPIHLPGGAANSALMLVTVGLAQVHAPKGIRIIGINPGSTMTDRVKEGLAVAAKLRGISPEQALAEGQAKVPLRRFAAPEDIANAVLFLASDKASYITGTILPLDGGANAVI